MILCDTGVVLLVTICAALSIVDAWVHSWKSREFGKESSSFDGKMEEIGSKRNNFAGKFEATNEKRNEEPDAGCRKLILQSDGSNFFNHSWATYKTSFRNQEGNYWSGLDEMHRLTRTGRYKLRIDLQAAESKRWHYAEYTTFHVGNESTNYRVTIDGFSETVEYNEFEDSHNGAEFSTFDRDNDRVNSTNCASFAGGGFWYGRVMCGAFFPTAKSSVGLAAFTWFGLEDIIGWVRLSKARMQLLCKD